MESASPILSIKDLNVTYPNGIRALKNVNLSIESGKIYGIIGPSGSGKSSFIKAILGLVPHSGEVLYKGALPKRHAKDIAYLEQKEVLDRDFPITAFQCALLGTYPRLGLFKRPGEEEKSIATESLARVNMLPYKDRQIGELSGGQFQRVLIARTLAQNAELLLMDEPFTGIDVSNEEALITLLKKMAAEGKTILVIHHDLSKAHEYFDEVILIHKKVIAAGKTAEVFTPENIEKTYKVFVPALSQV